MFFLMFIRENSAFTIHRKIKPKWKYSVKLRKFVRTVGWEVTRRAWGWLLWIWRKGKRWNGLFCSKSLEGSIIRYQEKINALSFSIQLQERAMIFIYKEEYRWYRNLSKGWLCTPIKINDIWNYFAVFLFIWAVKFD